MGNPTQIKPHRLSSVDRALALIEIIAEREGLNLTDLSKLLGSNKPTTFRLATALVNRGWLSKNKSLRYSLGPTAHILGARTDDFQEIETRLMPLLEELHRDTQETVHLVKLEGRYATFKCQLLSTRSVIAQLKVGEKTPVHCTSAGMALLAATSDENIDWFLKAPLQRYTSLSPRTSDEVRAEIARVRARGYAVNHGAYRKDVNGIGAAVLNRSGVPVAGISVSMPLYRFTEIDVDALGCQIVDAARAATELIGELQ